MSAKRDEATRELDARVALEVMGWKRSPDSNPPNRTWTIKGVRVWRDGKSPLSRALPQFSSDIRAAWLVVEKLTGFVSGRDEPWWSVAIFNAQQGQVGCRVYACQPGSNIFDVGIAHALPGDDDRIIAEAVASSAPHAICLAALAALSERAS